MNIFERESTNVAESRIKVAIAGVNGRMGRASLNPILHDGAFELVGAFGRRGARYVGCDISELTDAVEVGSHLGLAVSNSFEEVLELDTPDVLLDFTVSELSVSLAKTAIERGIRPVIGTSGLTKDAVAELSQLCAEKRVGALVVPNFSIGAVLMMEFSRQAAKHYSNVEIVEMHHTKKIDAPSGTASHTINKIAAAGKRFNEKEVREVELMPHARGAEHNSGVRVHSLRLPGLISHQEVFFGSDGELLTIKHDSFNTNCFLKGIALSIKEVMKLSELKVGLESILLQG